MGKHSILTKKNNQSYGGIGLISQGIIFIFLFCNLIASGQANCVGRFLNPISDICWKCIFPLKIAGVEIVKGNPSPKGSNSPICSCPSKVLRVNVPGIPISFWEPVRLIDVTRTPYCLVNMGGKQIASMGVNGRGDVEEDPSNGTHHSFYHVHWYIYPVIYWLEVLADFICLDNSSIDLSYLTELDPLWSDDEKSLIINPEAGLFGRTVAQAACVADCLAASVKLPFDSLFWCNGCQGSLYPFSGTVTEHMGGVQASLLITGRFMAKLHREGLLFGTYGIKGLCDKYPMPIIKKSQYRLQMTYPIPTSRHCYALGHTEFMWQGNKEFPYKGSDFGYLVWRKRDCCLRAIP
ncbi:MAG: TraU family protein [Candidatus Paracaedibacteraceae bacterium]|nr:TraU family protein [Candidatus Paracaedibacteraceae bacterium]